MTNLTSHSAYHGGSWQPRILAHDQELNARKHWSNFGINSEWRPLRKVMLYRVPQRAPRCPRPEKIQHLRRVDWRILGQEMLSLSRVLKKNGVEVIWQRADEFAQPKPNAMFVRDQFMLTPWGAVLGRMASEIRAGEEKWAQLTLAKAGIPLLALIRGQGTFEGADALWLSAKHLLVGVGNRTNQSGFKQIKDLLAEFSVKVSAIEMPTNVQHLLGLLQIIAPNRALVRVDQAPTQLIRILQGARYSIVAVLESDEVVFNQGMNVLCLGPNRIVMPQNCPQLVELFSTHKIEIVAQVKIGQLLNAAGGIACATAPLARGLSVR